MGEPIFREYDRQALDREYNNRSRVPNSAEYIAWFTKEGEVARRELNGRLDVRYGPGPAETLDIFPGAGSGPAPVQLFIHGGYWRALDKADFSYVARGFRPAGAITVVVNYALIPSVDMDEVVRQARRNSPIHLAPARSGPLLLPLGALEGPEYHRQTDEMAAAWRSRGLRCETLDMRDQDHFSIVAQLNDPTSPLSKTILYQMGL